MTNYEQTKQQEVKLQLNEEAMLQAQKNFIFDAEAQDYLIKRGISPKMATICKVGYLDNYYGRKCIVFPTGLGTYAYRSINDKDFRGSQGGTGLFNAELLETSPNKYIFVCEAPIDAMSIFEVGEDAISIQGVESQKPLLDYLREHTTDKILVLSFDNDAPGRKAQKQLSQALNELNVTNVSFNWSNCPSDVKDMNDYLLKDKVAFMDSLEASKKYEDPSNLSEYLKSGFLDDIQENHDKPKIMTGFNYLDADMKGFNSGGLYILASISSLGKTTLVHQIADNVATSGHKVIYFSLEQSKNELVSKSLNRYYYQTHSEKEAEANKVNSLTIRNKEANIDYNSLVTGYSNQVKSNMSVIEGNFSCTFDYVKNYVTNYVNNSDNHDVLVIIDYLQILDFTDKKLHLSDKEKVDYVVKGLKRLARDLNITILAISSVNRGAYLNPIDFESLKETGSIEFTADMVLGLQLSIMDKQEYEELSDKKIVEKRKKIKEAKMQLPYREVTLVCLKNRYGVSSFETHFKYYPIQDIFRDELKDNKQSKQAKYRH